MLTRSFVAGSICTGVALVGAFGGAAHAQSASPIQIDSCAPIINNTANPFAQGSPPPSIAGIPLATTSSGMAITFVNNASKTADLVNFSVDSNGERFIIRDVGTFSPGVQIVHTYRNGAGRAFVLPQFIAPRVSCHVASVRFSDGSVWRPGQQTQPIPAGPMPAPPLTSRVLSAFPARLVTDSVTESELFMISSLNRVAAFKETDTCAGIANVFVAATAESSATFSVKPIAPGDCTATITDEDGNGLDYPISVR